MRTLTTNKDKTSCPNLDNSITAFCPICNLDKNSIQLTHADINNNVGPRRILNNLKLRGVVPKDFEGQTLDPKGWERAIYFHIKQCLNADCDLYRRKVKLSEENKEFNSEIKDSLNEIIANQLKIIKQEQKKIMEGENSPNFLEQIKSLKLLLSAI